MLFRSGGSLNDLVFRGALACYGSQGFLLGTGVDGVIDQILELLTNLFNFRKTGGLRNFKNEYNLMDAYII